MFLSVCYLCCADTPRVAASSRSARPSASSRTPTTTSASPPKGKGSRSRSKSPFRSFRWKKSSKSQLASGGASDDEAAYDDDEGCISTNTQLNTHTLSLHTILYLKINDSKLITQAYHNTFGFNSRRDKLQIVQFSFIIN